MILQEITFDENVVGKKSYISYGIRSDSLIPASVTSILGIEPKYSFAKGDQFTSRVLDKKENKIIERVLKRPWGVWCFDTYDMVSTRRIMDHANFILGLLEPKRKIIQNYIKNEREYSLSFNIWWEPFEGQGSYEIENNILLRMSKLCHYIEFSFYCSEKHID